MITGLNVHFDQEVEIHDIWPLAFGHCNVEVVYVLPGTRYVLDSNGHLHIDYYLDPVFSISKR